MKQEEVNLLNDGNEWDIYVEVLSDGHD